MTTTTQRTRLAAGLLVLAMIAGARVTFAHTPNVVIQWSQVLQTLYGTGPGVQLRSLPMMHIAMFDAINAIEGAGTSAGPWPRRYPFHDHLSPHRGTALGDA